MMMIYHHYLPIDRPRTKPRKVALTYYICIVAIQNLRFPYIYIEFTYFMYSSQVRRNQSRAITSLMATDMDV